jgi:hypothetical protein
VAPLLIASASVSLFPLVQLWLVSPILASPVFQAVSAVVVCAVSMVVKRRSTMLKPMSLVLLGGSVHLLLAVEALAALRYFLQLPFPMLCQCAFCPPPFP